MVIDLIITLTGRPRGPSDKYSVDFMNVDQRIDLLTQLGEYCVSAAPALSAAKRQAQAVNGWFTPEFIDLALHGIATEFLQKDKLQAWAEKYRLADEPGSPFTPLDSASASNDNLYYTGTAGHKYNVGSGLGTPNLAALAGDFGRR